MPNYLDFGDYMMLPKLLKCKHHSYLLASLSTFVFYLEEKGYYYLVFQQRNTTLFLVIP